jgi:hypothetical protein
MIDYKKMDLDNITYHIPKKIDGKYIGSVLYNNDKIRVKTPFLKCMNAINISENRCYIEFELDTNDKDLYDFFADLDDLNMHHAYQNSEKWFGNQFPLDIIDEYYKRFIRYNSKLQRPYIKINIPYSKNGGILLDNINKDDFKLNNLMSLNLVHDGIRFFKQQFTSEWSLENYEVENTYVFKENLDDIENTVYEDINNYMDKNFLEKNNEELSKVQDKKTKKRENSNKNSKEQDLNSKNSKNSKVQEKELNKEQDLNSKNSKNTTLKNREILDENMSTIANKELIKVEEKKELITNSKKLRKSLSLNEDLSSYDLFKDILKESSDLNNIDNSDNIDNIDNNDIDNSEEVEEKSNKNSSNRIKGNIKPKIIRYAHKDRRWRY